jgi:MFS family permease
VATPPRRARAALAGLFVANGISLLGNQLTSLAIPWLVLTRLGGAGDAGLVGAGLILPAAIGAVGGGVVVDRMGRRRTSIVADVMSAAAVAAIPIAAGAVGLSVALLIVLAFLGSLFDAPGTTARQVILPDLADAAGIERESVNGLYQAVENGTLLVGPLLAGVIVLAFGPLQALWIDAASFLACAALVVGLVPPDPVLARPAEESIDILGGIRSIGRDAVLRGLTLVAVIANFAGTPLFVVLLPAFAAHAGYGPAALGVLLGAFGAGLLAGSLWFGARGALADRRRLLAVGLTGTGAGLIVAAAAGPFPVVVGALLLAGAATGPVNPIAFTIMQERIPVERRGRVFGAVLGSVLVAAPVGMVAFGLLAELVTAATGIAIAGLLFVVAAGLVVARPEFRDLRTAGGASMA